MASKAEGVGDGDVEIGLDGLVGGIVKVAFRIWLIQSDGRRDDAGVESHDGGDKFDATGSAEGMTHLRLGGADMCSVGFFLAHSDFDGLGLTTIVHRSTRAMSVDIQ